MLLPHTNGFGRNDVEQAPGGVGFEERMPGRFYDSQVREVPEIKEGFFAMPTVFDEEGARTVTIPAFRHSGHEKF